MKHIVAFVFLFFAATAFAQAPAPAQSGSAEEALMALTDIPDFKNPSSGWSNIRTLATMHIDIELQKYANFGTLQFRLNYSARMYRNDGGTMEAVLIEYPGGGNAAIFAAIVPNGRIFRYAIRTDKWYFAEKLYDPQNTETVIDLVGSVDLPTNNILVRVVLKTTDGWKNIEFTVPVPSAN